jgi:uridylate kinase
MIKGRNSHCYRWWKYFLGVAGTGMDRVQGDYMGMLATVINGMALQGIRKKGMKTRLQTALKWNL